MLKTTFKKDKPKLFKYHDYKTFDSAAFHTDLQNKLDEGPKVHQNFEDTFVRVLDAHAPRKGSIDNAGYPNGLPNWGTYLGITKNQIY